MKMAGTNPMDKKESDAKKREMEVKENTRKSIEKDRAIFDALDD